jgi:hypothetical protein
LDIAGKSIASCDYREFRLCLSPHPCGTLIRDFVDAHFTRRIVGFGVQGGIVDGAALWMFQRAIRGQTTPNYLSTL